MKVFRSIIIFFALMIIGLIINLNINLYYSPELKLIEGKEINIDLLKQLNYLQIVLNEGVADELQNQYPEGYFFANLMYGLTWCEFASELPDDSNVKIRAIKESYNSIVNIESEKCKRNFYKDLQLEYGAFYFSWTNYLRSKILLLSNSFEGREKIENEFKKNCVIISEVIQNSDTPFIESYPNQYWPADIIPGIVSLSIHDKIYGEKYSEIIKLWFNKVVQKSKINQHLFPHSVDSEGKLIQTPRGSSLGLMLILIKEVKEIDIGNFYQGYMRAYLTDFIGLPMIKEYAEDDFSSGDVDSGPVIFNYGSVATIVGAGVFKRYGILGLAEQINQTIECVGIPQSNSITKKYLFGRVPMADIFIAWVKSLKSIGYYSAQNQTEIYWRLPFQILSCIIISLLSIYTFKNLKKLNL